MAACQGENNHPVWPVVATRKKQSTCESGGGSPQVGKKQSSSEQANKLFACATVTSRKKEKN